MTPPTISAILITFNEEDRLRAALESVRWADEIVVVDSGSTDRTLEIAREYTGQVHYRAWEGYGKQKQRALDLASGAWVIELDADEVVSAELAESIRRAVRDPRGAAGFSVERQLRYLGARLGSRGWRRERKVRVFLRERAAFRQKVIHESIEVRGPVGRLEGALYHDSYRDLTHHVAKINEFTSIIATDRAARGKRSSVLRAALTGAGYFFKAYVTHGGFLYGRAGFVHAAVNGFNGFLKLAKLWELEQIASAVPAPVIAPPAPRVPA